MGKKLKTTLRIIINYILIFIISVGFIVSWKYNSMLLDNILIFSIIGIIEFWRNPKK